MGSNLFPIILSKHLRWKMFGSIRGGGGGERGIGRKLVRGGLNRSFKGRNVSKGRGISVNGRWSRREEEEGSSEKRGSSPLSSVSFTALSEDSCAVDGQVSRKGKLVK